MDVNLSNQPSEDNLVCNRYSYTGKLAFGCFGFTTGKFFSPIFFTGGSTNKSLEEKKKGVCASIKRAQEEKATNELPVIKEGSHNKIECNLDWLSS